MRSNHPLWRLIDKYAAAWTASEVAYSQDAHPGTRFRRNEDLKIAARELDEALQALPGATP